MPPPPAEPFASRIFLGPALRAQPDRRLVKLVREGYEAAFEEIVRRYRRPLDRFAAAIVGNRSEDVTQDAFSKALLALRGTTTEIELRPWLYRIVRNTALNDLRDAAPVPEEFDEAIAGGRSAAVEAERREEIAELMRRLRALPEPQRAAIVMRELEGLSHEEIAAALGVSGGAARQAIYRARLTLRDGLGLLVPLPLLRLLFEHGTEAAAGAGGAVAAAGATSAAGGGAGATLGGLGAGGALKVGVATALLAGSIGAGVAMQQDRDGGGPGPAAASASQLPADAGAASGSGNSSRGSGQAPLLSSDEGRGRDGSEAGDDNRGDRGGDHRGRGSGASDDDLDDSSHAGRVPHGSSGQGGGGRAGGHSGSGDGSGDDDLGEGTSGGSHSGGHSSGSDNGGSSGRDGGNDGGASHSGSSGSGSGGGGSGSSGGSTATTIPPPPTEPPPDDDGEASHSGPGSPSSGSGSGSGSSGPIPADDDL
jgi:RNA polymerase sigma factor (sigma-70 family)